MKSVELFAGAGGLALGVARAGFEHQLVIECDPRAVETLEHNKERGLEPLAHWPVYSGRAESFDYHSLGSDISLVSGGPPCQPFSLGGKHGGKNDKRDMFPTACEVVNILRPKAFIFENVKGLMRSSFEPYLRYILNRLRYPELKIKPKEKWREHLKRLDAICVKDLTPSPAWYKVKAKLLNAANYGVPQRRERVVIVGVRSDLDRDFEYPEETHSFDSLVIKKYVTGEYWDEVGIAKKRRPEPSAREEARARTLSRDGYKEKLGRHEAWRTVRQALKGLSDIREGERCAKDPNHYLNPGARAYPGHTGSTWDEPAKTLKAGDHGVPGGENTVRLNGNGDVRYFSIREAARLQAFPDDYFFPGAWTIGMRQLGNAVPVDLGYIIAKKVAETISFD